MTHISDGPRAGYYRLVARIEEAGRTSTNIRDASRTFSCPGPNHANGDRNPSASAGYDAHKQAAWFHCHADCPQEDIAAGLGLELWELFDYPIRKVERTFPPDTSISAAMSAWLPCGEQGHRVDKVHSYTDLSGRLVAQKLKCSHRKKDNHSGVWWRRIDPSSGNGWRYNLDGITLGLYQPRDIAWSIQNELTLALCEGESDADEMHRRRICATSAPNGAWVDGRYGGKWRPEFTEALRGAFVCIYADVDPDGMRHAENVANEILPVVKSLEICKPAAGKDVREHFAAGLTLGDFITVAMPKPFVVDLDELLGEAA